DPQGRRKAESPGDVRGRAADRKLRGLALRIAGPGWRRQRQRGTAVDELAVRRAVGFHLLRGRRGKRTEHRRVRDRNPEAARERNDGVQDWGYRRGRRR